jgi:hypothetical protein
VATLEYLEEEGTLEPTVRPGEVVGSPRHVQDEGKPELKVEDE